MRINIEGYDLISLDIFDTLLLRTISKPIDLFLHVWEKAKNENICLTDISPMEFMKLRIEVERRARNKAMQREVNLDEIYMELPGYIVKNVERLKEIEIETEKVVCFKNFDIYDLVKQAKKRGMIVVLLSDMYLSEPQIRSILEHNKINTTYFDSIIVSNEFKCSKQNGELYKELFRLYPSINKDKILHIGDNGNSDFIQAKKAGINAAHYDVIPEKLHSIYDYEKMRHNVPQKGLLSLRKLVAASSENYQSDLEMTAYEIGASILGPFLTLFISGVCERLRQIGIERIYPLMREGFILGELLKREANFRDQKLLVKPIYISRKVTYLPSIEKIDKEEIENMIGARNLTIKESILLMGLDIELFAELIDYMEVSIKETHKIYIGNHISLREYLIKRFLEDKNRLKIEVYVKQQRALLNGYLLQEMGDLKNTATIDIGFFGRIQLWMEKSLDFDGIAHHIKHFLAIGVTGEKMYDGLKVEGYYGTMAENMDLITTIHRTTDVIEKLISVTEGSTIGYETKNGSIVPIKSEEVNNKKYLDIVFHGIFDFQFYWHKFKNEKPEHAKGIEDNRRETLMILHRLIDMPRLAEVDLMSKFEADTNFGTGYKKSIITEANIQLLKEKGVDYVDKCNVSYTYENSNITWPKGLVALEDEFYYLRRVLKSNTGNEILKAMQEVVEQVVEQGIREVALYGAGENGRQFYFLCNLYHIKVICFIDRKESLWGTYKEGIEIIGLPEAITRNINTFIITSLFSISEISDYIINSFKENEDKAIIFHV